MDTVGEACGWAVMAAAGAPPLAGNHYIGASVAKLPSMKPGLPSMGAAVPMAPKRAEAFYQSPEWRKLVTRRRLDKDYQQARARAKPGERLILDHKVERRDGGADLDPANTQWLTHSEHQAKTSRSKRARAGWS